MITRRNFMKTAILAGISLFGDWRGLHQDSMAMPLHQAAEPLDATTLTKYVDPLPIPDVVQPTRRGSEISYEVSMTQFARRLHRDLPPTTLWGYNGSYPGPTFEARVDQPVTVRWVNSLPTQHLLQVDTRLHGAEQPQNPHVRTVVHLHGGHVPAQSDGFPEAWLTPGDFDVYHYPNNQRATTLWYHDHALGITRLNVYTGLAGLYLLRDEGEAELNLPSRPYEIPIVLQDRSLDTNGQLVYPFPWQPEFFGDAAVVNGMVWPFLEVEPRKYRLRFLDGSSARFYNIKLIDRSTSGDGPPFVQIGTDGGLLPQPVTIEGRLLLGPGERADVVVDFSGFAGRELLLHNNARTPFSGIGPETPPAPDQVPLREIMLFRVKDAVSTPDTSSLPPTLSEFVRLEESSAAAVRDLILAEEVDPEGNVLASLLGVGGGPGGRPLRWGDHITEKPRLASNEIWQLINLTPDVHPIHLHEIHFQILDRQPFDVDEYKKTGQLVFSPDSPREAPDPNERGWKDTVRVNPGMVTRIIGQFTGFPGVFPWHCHILDHEDNEMMRPYEIISDMELPRAADGRALFREPARTQRLFRDTYGERAEAQWITEHNREIGASKTAGS
ncbi:MAG TPA: multicopper oxidase [Chloroflexota bacterium]|nr:multicopper oxidase [Chloroflexota bacterium]